MKKLLPVLIMLLFCGIVKAQPADSLKHSTVKTMGDKQYTALLNGDDLYDKASVQQLAQQSLAILGSMSEEPHRFGVLKTDGNKLKSIIEKPIHITAPALINAGAYKMDQRIFDHQLNLSARNEYEITDYVQYLAVTTDVTVISGLFWFPIGKPEDLAQAQLLDLDPLIKAVPK